MLIRILSARYCLLNKGQYAYKDSLSGILSVDKGQHVN